MSALPACVLCCLGKGGPKAKTIGGVAGPRFLIAETHVPKPPPGFKAATKLQWTPLAEEKVTGTIFEGLLDRFPLASPRAQGAEAEASPPFSPCSVLNDTAESDGGSSPGSQQAALPPDLQKDLKAASESEAKLQQRALESVDGPSTSGGSSPLLSFSSCPATPESSVKKDAEGAKAARLGETCVAAPPSSASPGAPASPAGSSPLEPALQAPADEKSDSEQMEGTDGGATSTRGVVPFRYRLDFVRLFDLFYLDEKELSLKTKKAGGAGSGGGGAGGDGAGPLKKKGVLDGKASQNVEICLKKYKIATLDDFKDLAAQIDDPTTLAIDSNLADNITQYWPDTSMTEALKAKTAEDVLQMPVADQLYYTLIQHVSLGNEKLNFFLQRRGVDEELDSKREKLSKYSQAIDRLAKTLESDAFQDILGLVVRLGNCVNRGSKEGFGFKMKDFVGQLASCVSKDRSTNLFRVLVATVLEQNPADWEAMRGLQEVDAAKGIDLKDLLQFGDIEKKLGAWTKQIGDRRSAFGEAADKMEAWIHSREALLQELKKQVEDAEELQLRLRGLMGLTKAECIWPEPLRWFGQFYTHFETTAKEYRGAKDRDRQKAEREVKKKNDSIRRACTVGGGTTSSIAEKHSPSVPFRGSSTGRFAFSSCAAGSTGGDTSGNFFSGVGAQFQSSLAPPQRHRSCGGLEGSPFRSPGGPRPLSPLAPVGSPRAVKVKAFGSDEAWEDKPGSGPAGALQGEGGIAQAPAAEPGEESRSEDVKTGEDGGGQSGGQVSPKEATQEKVIWDAKGRRDSHPGALAMTPSDSASYRVSCLGLVATTIKHEKSKVAEKTKGKESVGDEGAREKRAAAADTASGEKAEKHVEDVVNLIANVDEEGRGMPPRIMATWAKARSPNSVVCHRGKKGASGMTFPALLRNKLHREQQRSVFDSSRFSSTPHGAPSITLVAASHASSDVYTPPLSSCQSPLSPQTSLRLQSLQGASHGVLSSASASPDSCIIPLSVTLPNLSPSTGIFRELAVSSLDKGASLGRRDSRGEVIPLSSGEGVGGGSVSASFVKSELTTSMREDERGESATKARVADKVGSPLVRNKVILPTSTAPSGAARASGRASRPAGAEPLQASAVTAGVSEMDKEWVRCGGGYCRQSESISNATTAAALRGQPRDVGRTASSSFVSHGSSAALPATTGSGAPPSRETLGVADEREETEARGSASKPTRRRSHGAAVDEADAGTRLEGRGASKPGGKRGTSGKFQSSQQHQASPPCSQSPQISGRSVMDGAREETAHAAAERAGEATMGGVFPLKSRGAADAIAEAENVGLEKPEGRPDDADLVSAPGGRGSLPVVASRRALERTSTASESIRKVRTRVTGGREGSVERQATNPYIAANVPRNPRRSDPGGRGVAGPGLSGDSPRAADARRLSAKGRAFDSDEKHVEAGDEGRRRDRKRTEPVGAAVSTPLRHARLMIKQHAVSQAAGGRECPRGPEQLLPQSASATTATEREPA
ncbi:formin FRM3 [Besnoitia besnoiti]|uniref:Formin FRM3 n=1 Tax=Besnoitia besnoiti TaxID=94643 RepID=A0A2A9MJS5_BESBE|nr:formin FRM3 [Besnoitia besnoiti]PFH36501.1 formin FRM3 [Besnoitia besnoiti]